MSVDSLINNNKINKYLFIYNNNNKKPVRDTLFTNKINGETYHKLKEILLRERKPIGEAWQEMTEEYIIKHGDGNPTSTLDQFNEPGFMVTPAFFRKIPAWKSYTLKCSEPNYKKWTRRLDEFMVLEHEVTKLR